MSIYKPAGPAIQSFDFRLIQSQTIAATSGTLYLTAIDLPLGFTVSTIYWQSGSTALVNGTSPHYWTALFSSARALRGQSTDNTAKAVAASSLISDSLATPYTTTVAGQFYIGIMVNSGGAGTQPTMAGWPGLTAVLNANSVGGGKFNGSADTGLAATAPNPATTITQLGNMPWVGVA